MDAAGGIGEAFIARTVGGIVTASRIAGSRLLPDQAPLANEDRIVRVVQIVDVNVLPRSGFLPIIRICYWR